MKKLILASIASLFLITTFTNAQSEEDKKYLEQFEEFGAELAKFFEKPIKIPKNIVVGIVLIDGLEYQNQPFLEYKWEEAKAYCDNLTLNGKSNWRLPNRKELHKLSNVEIKNDEERSTDDWEKWFEKNKNKRLKNLEGKSYFIRKEFIENMPESGSFWSITEKSYSSAVLYVDFSNGSDSWYTKLAKNYVLCVREQ